MKNDTWLISRVILKGDKKAFNRLVELYQSPVRRFFLHLTDGNEELGKDLAQETFIKAWLNIASFRAASSFSTWLFRIAYNCFYDHTRSTKQIYNVEIENIKNNASDEIPYKDFDMDFNEALKILKEDERTVMLLFYMEDLSVKEIAKIMSCPVGTIKSHLFRGKKKLTDYMAQSGYDTQNINKK